jgi:GGDEF domain-containing protein
VVEARIRNTLDRWNAANPTLLPFRLDLAIGDAHWLPSSTEAIEEALAEADRRMYEQKRGAQ